MKNQLDRIFVAARRGGPILPMFNDFVETVRSQLAGLYDDPNGELMNGRALWRRLLA